MPAQSPSDIVIPDVTREYGLPGDQLDLFIDRFVAAARKDPFTTWLILPTERLVIEVTQHLLSRNIPVITSRICTLEGFCTILLEEHRTRERFLSESESKLLLSRILERNAKNFRYFAGHEHPSSGTIKDLREFMKAIIRRKITFPKCLLELESEKSRQLDGIISEYREHLHEGNLVDSTTILEWTIDHLVRTGSSDPRTVFLYGFHDLLPLEQELFNTIQEHAGTSTVFIPDGIDLNIFRSRSPAGDRPGAEPAFDPLSIRARFTGLFSGTGPFDAGNFYRARTFPSRYAEICGIAAEIRRLNSEGVPLSGISVIFSDLRDNWGLIEEVFADYGIPWNAAIGPRLSQSPLIQFLTGIICLATGGRSREDVIRIIGSPYFRCRNLPGGLGFPDAADVDLVSRYAGIDGPHPPWERRLAWLHQEVSKPGSAKNFPGISVQSVERVQAGLDLLMHDLDHLATKKTLREHVQGFFAFLALWDIPRIFSAPDTSTKEREVQVYKKFRARLEMLEKAAWLPDSESIDAQEFFRYLSAIAEEPDESRLQDADGVTVLGLWESQYTCFSVVFIGGLVEGIVPRLTTRLPFTNALENARMGTRSLSEILTEQQYYFVAALLSAQKTVYLSAPLADGEKPLLTSAFFEQVRMRCGDVPWPEVPESLRAASRQSSARDAGYLIRDETICAAVSLIPDSSAIDELVERINTERFHRTGPCDSDYDRILSEDPAILEALAGTYGPDHVWSPTSLETYASCPFAYFLGRVINLRELPEVELNLSASDRGTAIHAILTTFYRQWQARGHKNVTLASLTDATELILKVAAEELAEFSFESPLWDATRILMLGDKHTGPGYFERFLENEAVEEDSPLVPARFEFSFGMETGESDDPASVREPVELGSPDGNRKIRIHGRIDRIDLTPDGRFLIYDYKSGQAHPKAKDIEAGTALQLPLYLLAFGTISGNRGIGGGYYKIRREIARSIVLADPTVKDLMVSRVRPSADFAATIRHSLASAFEDIEGIRGGKFPLPAQEKCPNEYCEFRQVCRFDPYRVLPIKEET